jgi:hypothetical protein
MGCLFNRRGLIILVLALAWTNPLFAADDQRTLPPTWQEQAAGVLIAQDLIKLDKEHFVITNQSCKQVFEPYINAKQPVFVTADVLLNAYCVLLERSMAQLESAQAERLVAIARELDSRVDAAAASIRGDEKLIARSKQRAKVVIAVARRLLGDETFVPEPSIAALTELETRRITAALPVAVADQTDGIARLDYTRFKPRGFYDRTPLLRRYFRAIAWLESVPFLAKDDEQLTAACMIFKAAYDQQSPDSLATFARFTPGFWARAMIWI